MVLIAASVFTKGGKALVTRQYVADMTRSRLEGLLDAFPKLVVSEKSQRQHTFVETDSVRYVYQPLDNLYMMLITTKASNILEDLETLRLFSRVIPEYCRSHDESEILEKAFDLIFAFDEIVVLGYRENVNLAQIRTFTEMDSHEERVYNQIQIAQQRAAQNTMTEKAKEIRKAEKLKKTLGKAGLGLASATGIGSNSVNQLTTSAIKDFGMSSGSALSISLNDFIAGHGMHAAKTSGGGKALKLGHKSTADDAFLQQLCTEDKNVSISDKKVEPGVPATTYNPVDNGPIHFKYVEKISAEIKRGGDIKLCEVSGSISLVVAKPELNTVRIQIQNDIEKTPGYCARDSGKGHKDAKLQVHPNLDKSAWQDSSLLRLKSEQKPYPVGTDVGVLKWSIPLPNEQSIPLILNCWASENPNGCDVNIEYSLQRDDMQLDNVHIVIPLPPSINPTISECQEGNYEYVRSKSQLVWTIPVIDRTNGTAQLEFSTSSGHENQFFPVNVQFTSNHPFAKISIIGVDNKDNESIEYTTSTSFQVEKYEVC